MHPQASGAMSVMSNVAMVSFAMCVMACTQTTEAVTDPTLDSLLVRALPPGWVKADVPTPREDARARIIAMYNPPSHTPGDRPALAAVLARDWCGSPDWIAEGWCAARAQGRGKVLTARAWDETASLSEFCDSTVRDAEGRDIRDFTAIIPAGRRAIILTVVGPPDSPVFSDERRAAFSAFAENVTARNREKFFVSKGAPACVDPAEESSRRLRGVLGLISVVAAAAAAFLRRKPRTTS